LRPILPELSQNVQQAEAVFAAANRNRQVIVELKHVIAGYGLADFGFDGGCEAFFAESFAGVLPIEKGSIAFACTTELISGVQVSRSSLE